MLCVQTQVPGGSSASGHRIAVSLHTLLLPLPQLLSGDQTVPVD